MRYDLQRRIGVGGFVGSTWEESLDSWVARARSRVRSNDGKLFESTDDAVGGC